MTVKDLTDDELIARITETYGLTRYGGDVAELVRRYRDSSFRLSRIANDECPEVKPSGARWEGRQWPPVPPREPTFNPAAAGEVERKDEELRRKADAQPRKPLAPGGDIGCACESDHTPATQVATAPEKPVATTPRGSTGQCGCGAPLDSTGRCTWGPTPRCRLPRTAAGVIELCQRVLDPPARYEDVRALAEWVLTTGLVGRLCPCGSPLDEQGRCPVHTRLMRDVTGKT